MEQTVSEDGMKRERSWSEANPNAKGGYNLPGSHIGEILSVT